MQGSVGEHGGRRAGERLCQHIVRCARSSQSGADDPRSLLKAKTPRQPAHQFGLHAVVSRRVIEKTGEDAPGARRARRRCLESARDGIRLAAKDGAAQTGTGNVVSGICGSLMAQIWPAWEAAIAAVWPHAAAADRLVERGVGPVGLTASELIPVVREILNRLIEEQGN